MRPHLRLPIVATLLAGLLATSALAAPRIDGRRVVIPAADAQQFLEGRFPRQQDVLGGLFEITASQPRLALPPGTRLRLGVDLAVATAGGAPVPMGHLVMTSALRYDASRQALFLDRPGIEAFQPNGGGEGLDEESRALLNAWLADYARKEPVYRIDPAIAAILGNLQVQSAGVQDGQLVLGFNQDLGAVAGALPPAE